jgi:asparagine synthase (glutamine-hydrolysing)
MAFNGEIYNHKQLRLQLDEKAAHITGWRGHSDTETLLAGFEAWGVESTLKKTVGMFAIALWDRDEKTLTLIRDRFGEKPLYYGWVGSGHNAALVFGSELKALRAYPGFSNSICRQALALYMRFTYVPAPHSIYQNIFKLEPGCMLSLSGALPPAETMPLRPPANYDGISLSRWWSLLDAVQVGAKNQINDEVEAVQLLEQRLSDAVRMQSLSDVPLGAFLSGGVDSSTIVALMQQQAIRPLKTFTVGFENSGYDESPYARAIANHIGSDHSEMFVTAADAQSIIPSLPSIYDEPFADSSQIPMHLLCKVARQQVTVSLSGDAGDELFGGYNRYYFGPRIWNWLNLLPYPARQALSKTIVSVPVGTWDEMGSFFTLRTTGEKLHKLGRAIKGVRSLHEFHLNLVSEWQESACVVRGGDTNYFASDIPFQALSNLTDVERMMYLDSITYLPDDILCKVDRAAMAASLETRVPFLDHRVAELAWQLPLHMKIRGNERKWALRRVLYKYVPSELINRPKAGFAIPIGQWLRGPLCDWAESLLTETRLQNQGYFHPAPIRQKWIEHLSGKHDHTPSLWTVLMFQAWLEETG